MLGSGGLRRVAMNADPLLSMLLLNDAERLESLE